MHNLDGLRATLGCRDGETVFEAAERVVRERDKWRDAAMAYNMAQPGNRHVPSALLLSRAVLGPRAFDFSQWRDHTEDR
jgi:hypothetical protein